jgi:hypothetical protein
MKIGLIDVDGHNFPNLALMKISAVFTFTEDIDTCIYVMIYEKWKAPKQIKQMARWVNNKFIWRSCERFKDYIGGAKWQSI